MKKYLICLLMLVFIVSGCEKEQPKVIEDVKTVETNVEETPEIIPEEKAEKAEKVEEKVATKVEEKKPQQEVKKTAETPEESPKTLCTLSVRCDTVLNNLDKIAKNKVDFIPKNGIIFYSKNVSFKEGDTIFDVLLNEMKQNNIPFEFSNTAGSVYIEGIGGIYEFDCGDLSGWMYKLNGEFLKSSASGYTVKNGDVIEFVYSCNLGKDVGEKYE